VETNNLRISSTVMLSDDAPPASVVANRIENCQGPLKTDGNRIFDSGVVASNKASIVVVVVVEYLSNF
jgi:hypothetical protein